MHEHETAHDIDEISSQDSNWVELSDSESEVNTTSFEQLITHLQSPPLPPASQYPTPEARHNFLVGECHTVAQIPSVDNTSEYDSDEDMDNLDPRRALAAIERERPTPVQKDTGYITDPDPVPATAVPSTIHSRVAHTVATLLAPPASFSNLIDNTYTLSLDWAMGIIGESEFVEGPFMRKVLRAESPFRRQMARDAGLPREVVEWLGGQLLMKDVRFDAGIFGGGPADDSGDHLNVAAFW